MAASGVASAQPAASAPADPVRPLSTPILSVRRVPAWTDDTLARQRLDVALSAATAGPLVQSKVPACVLVSQDGDDLFALDPTAELMPASNEKLLTGTAALAALGPGYHFTTEVASRSRPAGGVITGDLYLAGGGDPDLMTAAYDATLFYPEPTYTSLDQLAAAVKAAGITAVTGSVVGDGSRYDSLTAVPTWSPVYEAEGDVGPLGGLEVDDGTPAPPVPGQPLPPRPSDPARSAAAIFTARLEADGVKVRGPATVGSTPGGTVTLAREASPSLGEMVEQMERVSDDTAAELLTKELGKRLSGQGSTTVGLATIRRYLAAAALPVGEWTGLDGSGLDRGDRASCRLITAVVAQAGPSSVLADGLPVADRTGTLTNRLAGTPAAGRVHAKTGTLVDVAALSGFVVPPATVPTPALAGPVYFSIIINGMDSRVSAPLTDRIAAVIAAYPQAVLLRQLGPEP
jgi:D-alanyl-D-alanine carboxypeptidase/D-alanyl-D-alanine-endopeptidase (penicillin-binding protein 4)